MSLAACSRQVQAPQPERTGQATLILLRLLLDTVVLHAILWLTLRQQAPRWLVLGALCLAMAIWKQLLYTWMGDLAIVPVLLSVGLVVRLLFSIPTRKTLVILGAFVVARILLASIVNMASGVLNLFFL